MKTLVECLAPTDTVQLAACRMRDLNLGFLPVCDETMQPVGTLTDRDIAIRVCPDERPASALQVAYVMTNNGYPVENPVPNFPHA